jgi:hypothetical protein
MKTITIQYHDGGFTSSPNSPITVLDTIILFLNTANRAVQINFRDPSAFGIGGIFLAPQSEFTLVYRGVPTQYHLSEPRNYFDDTHNPTIPPG